MPRFRLAALLAALVLFPTAPAVAADIDVTTAGELTAALATAAASPGADRILLAPGVYDTGATPFSYSAADPVELVGAGRASTTITGSAGNLVLLGGNASNAVSGLTIALLPTVNGFDPRRGLQIDGGSVTDVTITSDPLTMFNVTAVEARATTTITGLVTSGMSARSVWATGGTTTVVDSTLGGGIPGQFPGVGVQAEGSSVSAQVSRTKIAGHGIGLFAAFGGTLTAADTLVEVPVNWTGLLIDDNGNIMNGFTGTLTADRMTLIGPGTGFSTAAAVGGNTATDLSTMTIRDSVIEGFSRPFGCFESNGATATIATDHVNSVTTGQVDNCGGGITHVDRSEHVPGFVDALAHDFRLRHDSPLVDAGRPAVTPLLAAFDVDGLTRVVDGNGDAAALVDIGAFEYQRRAPVATALAGLATLLTGQSTSFSAQATDADPGEQALLQYAWSFDDGGAATGANTDHAFATPGPHTATVTVTDPAGATTQAVAQVEVVAAPPPLDARAPVLTRLRTLASIRLGTALPKVVATRFGQIRLRLSERATVTVVLQRRTAGRYRTVRAFRLRAPAGNIGIRFRARFTRTAALRPGTYRLRAFAVDGAGNRSRTVTSRGFRVVK